MKFIHAPCQLTIQTPTQQVVPSVNHYVLGTVLDPDVLFFTSEVLQSEVQHSTSHKESHTLYQTTELMLIMKWDFLLRKLQSTSHKIICI